MALTKLNYTGQGTIPIASIPTITGAKMPTGSVLQTVNASTSTSVSTTGSSYIDTGLTATITPTSTTSKILVFVSQTGISKAAGNGGVYLRLLRDTTNIVQIGVNNAYTGDAAANRIGGAGTTYLDSPATTSAITYKTQFYAFNGITAFIQQDSSKSTITLQEIAG